MILDVVGSKQFSFIEGLITCHVCDNTGHIGVEGVGGDKCHHMVVNCNYVKIRFS